MDIKTVNAIHFSPTGGTKKVVDILAGSLGKHSRTVDLCSPAFADTVFGGDDLCIIGVPAYGGRVPATAAERLNRLQGQHTPAVLVAVYGNRAIEDTLLELHDLLAERGFITVAGISAIAEHSIVRQIAAGRPDAQDGAQLEGFATRIQARLSAEQPACVHLPGNRPYREFGGGPLYPAANKSCVQCGLCARQCPAGAIPAQAPDQTDTTRCVACMRCIAVCPYGARKLDQVLLHALSQKLEKLCIGRKENELFL